MARKKSFPRYRLHKASGLARVIVNGKHVYLGPFGSEESHAAYAKLLADHLGDSSTPQASSSGDLFPDLSVNELLVLYLKYARDYYSKDGKPTKEYVAMRDALVPMRMLFSHLAAREFGPLRLKAVLKHLVDEGRKCRTEINKQVKRIRRVFRWAVSEELVPPSVHAALAEVEGLKRGRTRAREAPRVLPVEDAAVEATIPYLSPPVAAMVRIQRLTGCRPAEVTAMRMCEIDTAGDVWLYRPTDHKNAWREHERVIALGPKAQEVLKPFVDRSPTGFLFSPIEAEAWRNGLRSKSRDPDRKTPVYPSELRSREQRKEERKARVPKRPKRDRYDVDSYRRAVKYAVDRANRHGEDGDAVSVPQWHPYQLRHTAATELRKRFGIEAVPLGLGNSADLAELYAERDMQMLQQIAREVG